LLDGISAGYRLVGRGRTRGRGGLRLTRDDVALYDALLAACRAAQKGEATTTPLPRRLSLRAQQVLDACRANPSGRSPRRVALEILAILKKTTPSYLAKLLPKARKSMRQEID
jgi:hypothetical protein